jgi:hypothetical protein
MDLKSNSSIIFNWDNGILKGDYYSNQFSRDIISNKDNVILNQDIIILNEDRWSRDISLGFTGKKRGVVREEKAVEEKPTIVCLVYLFYAVFSFTTFFKVDLILSDFSMKMEFSIWNNNSYKLRINTFNVENEVLIHEEK